MIFIYKNRYWIGFVLLLAFAFGWVMNIVKIINDDMDTGFLVVRSIGALIAPLGAILGYF